MPGKPTDQIAAHQGARNRGGRAWNRSCTTRRTMLRFAILLATGMATACVSASDDDSAAPCDGKCDDSSVPTIRFTDDFSQTVSGALVAGGTVRIDYDLDRLQDCRGSTGGSEVWGVSGYAQFDDGEPQAFGLSRLSGGRVVAEVATLEVPDGAARMTTWFYVSNRWGCIAYDSNYGANYDFDIAAIGNEVVLDFAADYTQTPDSVRAGDRAIVHYDPARLETCAGSTGGHAAWGITGYWQVDGGPVRTLAVAVAAGPELVAADPTLVVPAGRDLAFWFEATNVWGCHAWDSAFGENFHIAIE
jgi:hypothetical protein